MKPITMYQGTILIQPIILSGYTPQDGDVFLFGVKKDLKDNGYAIKQTWEGQNVSTEIVIHISNSQTENLEPGQYVYEIGLMKASGGYHIIIPPSPFVIKAHVTKYTDAVVKTTNSTETVTTDG